MPAIPQSISQHACAKNARDYISALLAASDPSLEIVSSSNEPGRSSYTFVARPSNGSTILPASHRVQVTVRVLP